MWWWLAACGAEESGSSAETGTPVARLDLADWVAAGEGSWVGTARQTPLGDIPFAITLGATADGAEGTAANGYGFSLTFDYAVDADGDWTLTETGTLPGGVTQTQVLAPVSRDGDRVVWRSAPDPEYLEVVADHTGDALVLEAMVRGETHAVLDLARAGR